MNKGECIGRGRTADVYTCGDHAVLKLFHPGKSIGNEASNARILFDPGIPSPEVIDVVEIEGRKGIIYERIDGVTMMKLIEPTSESITKYAILLAEFQSHIHNFRIDHPPNLRKRMINGITNNRNIDEDQRKHVIDLLNTLTDENVVCHFDVHPDNVMITDKGPYLIDWADVLVGHRLADVCWTSLLLKSSAMPVSDTPLWLKDRSLRLQFHDIYMDTYFRLNSNYDREEVASWIKPIAMFRLGIVVKDEFDLLNIYDSER